MLPGFGGMIAGGGGGNVTLNGDIADSAGTGVRTASYRLSSDGFVYHGDQGVYTSQYRWTSDPASNYEARLTLVSGTSPSGSSVGAWLALSADRTWSETDTLADGVEVYAYTTVEIRNATSLAVVATAAINIIADRT